MNPASRWRRGAVGVAVAVSAATGGCASADDPPAAAPSTTRAEPATTTPPEAPSTTAPGIALCGLLSQADLDAVAPGLLLASGVDATARATIGSSGAEAACEWYVSSDDATFTLTLVLATDVTSEDYETILADPMLGDPFTVADLGEMASAGSIAAGRVSPEATAYVLVYDALRLVQLTSQDASVLGRDPLVALVRTLLPRT